MRKVKCKYCEEQFDRDTEEYVKISTRYAHKTCHEKHLQSVENVKLERERVSSNIKAILDLCKKLFGDNADYPRIQQQINTFLNNGLTANGILKALEYHYIIHKNPTEKGRNSIGIVPYVYEDAKRYYINKYLVNEANKDKKVETQITTISILPPIRHPRKTKAFDFLDKGEDDEK